MDVVFSQLRVHINFYIRPAHGWGAVKLCLLPQ